MDRKQSGAVVIVSGLLLLALVLYLYVRGLDPQYDDPCAGKDITTCKVDSRG